MPIAAQKKARRAYIGERQKAWARLALLGVVGLVCPPLAAAKLGFVWALYAVLAILYSLWGVRATRRVSRDRVLGYLLCLTDAAVLLPMVVWSLGNAMRVVLVLLWTAGTATTWFADRAYLRQPQSACRSKVNPRSHSSSSTGNGAKTTGQEAPLERALRARLRTMETGRTRFAIVLLRITGYEAIESGLGRAASKEFIRDTGRRGLRLLNHEAQLFVLRGGRMAYVFSTERSEPLESGSRDRPDQADCRDVESVAMALAQRACEAPTVGPPLECVVGWASAPADGVTADDLMYAAQTGALSSAAFRRVGASRIPVPEVQKRRAVAG